MKDTKQIILTFFLLLMAGTLSAQTNVMDEVVWIVGDEAILKSDVEMLRLQSEYENEPIEGDPYTVIPEELAIQKLFLHQAELDSIEVAPSDVEDRVEEHLQSLVNAAASEEALTTYRNQTLRAHREHLTKSYMDQYKIYRVRANIVGDNKITPAEVRRYYKTIPEDSLPLVPAQVEVQIITASPYVPDEEIDRVKAEVMVYADRVNNGESFALLARMYSEDGSRIYGGELGYSGRAEWVPEFSSVAFSLTDPKTVSKIVKTEYGYHIIQLIDRKGDKVNCRHILRRPIISQEEIDKTLNRLDSVVDKIKDGTIGFEEAVTLFSEDKDTRNSQGIMSFLDYETGTSTTRIKMQDLHQLHQEVAIVVERLKVGEVADAFEMVGSSGMKVCSVV